MAYYNNYNREVKLTLFWFKEGTEDEISQLELTSSETLYQAEFKFYSNKPPFMFALQYYSSKYEASDLYCQERGKNWISDRSHCKDKKQCWCKLIDQLIWEPNQEGTIRLSFADKDYYQLRVRMKLNPSEDKKDEQKTKKDEKKDEKDETKKEETKENKNDEEKDEEKDEKKDEKELKKATAETDSSESSSDDDEQLQKKWKFTFIADIVTKPHTTTYYGGNSATNYNTTSYRAGSNAADYTNAYAQKANTHTNYYDPETNTYSQHTHTAGSTTSSVYDTSTNWVGNFWGD